MPDAREQLIGYLDRIGVPGAADIADPIAALRIAAEIVRGNEDDAVTQSALFWVRDASIGVGSEETKEAVRSNVNSILVPALAEALGAPNIALRSAAIYTFGKMSFPEHLSVLRGVLERYLDRDPILLPKLLGEMQWLGLDENQATAIRASMRTHSSWLTRWAFFGTDAGEPDETLSPELDGACHELQKDASKYVKAEAKWILAGAPFKGTPLRFINVMMRFPQKGDYDLASLAAFVEGL